MTQVTNIYKYLKRNNDFIGSHSIHTPELVVNQVLSKIDLNNKSILVVYNVEFLVSLVYTCKVNPANITFLADHPNKVKWAQRLGLTAKRIINKLDTNMKFDTIIGNPPYNDAHGTNREESKNTNNSNLYFDFILNSIEQASAVSLIVPSAWMTNDKIKNKMVSAGLKSIMSVDPTYFPNVGIRSGITAFNIDQGYNGNIDIINQGSRYSINRNSVLSFENPKKYTIIEKLKSANNLGSHLKTGKYIIKKGTKGSIDRLLQHDTTYSKILDSVYNTQVLIYAGGTKKPADYLYSSIKQASNKPAIAIPNASDKFKLGAVRVVAAGIGISDRHKAVYFATDAEAINAQQFLNSKLIKFVIGTTKHNDTVSTNKNAYGHIPMIDFTKNWTDQELYTYFNLTQDEVAYIEANVK